MAAMIYCPFPDRDSVREIAGQLLDERLIACANIFGDMESLFVWESKRDCGKEVGVLMKTDAGLLDQAIERLGELHPYDTPAVVGWRCDSAAPATREWLASLKP